jgi:hypothetical protein
MTLSSRIVLETKVLLRTEIDARGRETDVTYFFASKFADWGLRKLRLRSCEEPHRD